HQHPGATNEKHGQTPIYERNGAGNRSVEQETKGRQGNRRNGHTCSDGYKRVIAHEAYYCPVQPQFDESENRHAHRQKKDLVNFRFSSPEEMLQTETDRKPKRKRKA